MFVSVGLVDFTYHHRYEREPNVLYKENHGVCAAEELHGYHLGDAGPHGAWHEREGNAEYDDDDDGKPPVGEYRQGEEYVNESK